MELTQAATFLRIYRWARCGVSLILNLGLLMSWQFLGRRFLHRGSRRRSLSGRTHSRPTRACGPPLVETSFEGQRVAEKPEDAVR